MREWVERLTGIRFTSGGHLAYAAVTLLGLAVFCGNEVAAARMGRSDAPLAIAACLVHTMVGGAAYIRLYVRHEPPEFGVLGLAPDCVWFNAALALSYGGLLWVLWT